ncbi:MAG: hypothetical protein M0R21_03080 [Lentimicrobiaceae bacterium]|jgi:hypothetical protein|nr:hypothetical protein [Lentimicrobiaceae bacterium]
MHTSLYESGNIKCDDFIRHGEDFLKIELYSNAKECFLKALTYCPDDLYVKEKIVFCRNSLKKDTLRICIVVPVVVAIATFLILWLR